MRLAGWLLIAGMATGCWQVSSSSGTDPVARSAQEVPVEDLAKRKDLVVVDVRTPEEFAAGHAPGAINVPVDEISAAALEAKGFNAQSPIAFVCEVGGRSARATDLMNGQGWNTLNAVGGMSAWRSAGLPTE
jgi:rhodanese-related sulfurtransferase